MASNRVDKDTLTSLSSRIYEIKDLVCNFVLCVKQNLVLLINPVKGQVCNTNAFPHVAHSVTSTIHNVGHFISDDKFQVLSKSIKITGEMRSDFK